jgi:hypothetical protein
MDNDDNLLFPNPDNPLEGPPPLSDMLADVDTGKALISCARNHIIYYVALYCTLIRLQLIATVISPLNQCIAH